MDFAKNLLKKYGWNEGEGLGKNNTGIKNPLKANYKFDNAGLGVDKAADFKNHWWERVYNDAANNIKVNQNGDDLSISVKKKDSVEISTKDYSVKKLKKLKGKSGYNNFLQASTLIGENRETENPDKIEVDDLKLPEYKPLTDEELYAACGGRTAHKGARHGLQLKGKLSRIEEQEREFMAKLQEKSESTDTKWKVVKSKKKNKRKLEEEDTTENSAYLFTAEYCVKSKKKKKKEKQIDNDVSTVLSSFSVEGGKTSENGDEEENSTEYAKKKKKRDRNRKKRIEISEVENTPATLDNECNSPIKKKKKSKKNQSEEVIVNETFLKAEENLPTIESKKKKNKLKRGGKAITEGNIMSLDYVEQ